MKFLIIYLTLLSVLSSCFFEADKVGIHGIEKKQKESAASDNSAGQSEDNDDQGEARNYNIIKISVKDDSLIIEGDDLDVINTLRIKNDDYSLNETFNIQSQTSTKVVAKGATQEVLLALGKVFDLFVTDAQGETLYRVDFTIEDGSIGAAKLSDMGATNGQVLSFNGTNWVPKSLNAALSFAGNWDASSNSPSLTGGGQPGDYYIVSVSGSHDLAGGVGTNSWAVGDWVIWNETQGHWDKIDNATSVTTFNGRNGAVVPQANDYTWAQVDKSSSALSDIADVDTTGVTTGDILKWDGSKWIVGAAPSGGGSSISNLSDIPDVDVTGINIGDMLKWDGTKWIVTAAPSGGTVASLNDITDVDTSAATGGYVLTWDGSKWIAAAASGGGGGSLTVSSVDSSHIVDGSIMNVDINAAAEIDQSKIANLVSDLADKMPLSGGTMTGDLDMGAQNIVTTGLVDGVDVGTLKSDFDALDKTSVGLGNVDNVRQVPLDGSTAMTGSLDGGANDLLNFATGNFNIVKFADLGSDTKQWEITEGVSNGLLLVYDSATMARFTSTGSLEVAEICDETGNNCRDISTGWGGSGGGTVTSVTGGNGLTGTVTASGSLDVNVDDATVEVNGSNQIQVKDAGITDAKLATGIDASKVSTGALPDSVLSANVSLLGSDIDSSEIVDGTIVNDDISATAAIAWSKIDKTGAAASDLGGVDGTRAINTNAGSALTGGGDLSADRSLSVVVDAATIEVNGSNELQVMDDAITSAKIADGEIVDADISASAAIAWSKIDKTGADASDFGGVPATRTIATSSGLTGGGDLSGDLTLALDYTAINYWTKTGNDLGINTGRVGVGTLTPSSLFHLRGIADATLSGTVDVISGDNTITGTSTNFNTSLVVGDIVDINGEVYKILTITNDTIATIDGTFIGSHSSAAIKKMSDVLVAQDALSNSLMSLSALGNLGIGSSANEKLTVGGVVSLAQSNTPVDAAGFGKLYVKADNNLYYKAVGQAEVAINQGGGASLTADSVDSSHIVDGSIVTADLAADSVTSANIVDGTITSADLAAGAITIDKVDFSSTTTALGLPNVGTTARDAIASPTEGMMIYNPDTQSVNVYSNGEWKDQSAQEATGVYAPVYTQVSSGLDFHCFILSDKTVRCVGNGGSGRLGDNTANSSDIPVAVFRTDGQPLKNVVDIASNYASTCAVTEDGKVWCWGYNNWGQIGNGTTTTDSYAAYDVGITNAVRVELGYTHTCALLDDGNMKCWGSNSRNILGTADAINANVTTPSDVTVLGTIGTVKDYSVGYYITCIVNTANELYCWGLNNHGQIGNGSTTDVTAPVLIALDIDKVINYSRTPDNSSIYNKTCAIKTDKTLYCWGHNTGGQIGDGTTTQRNSPTQVLMDSDDDGTSDGFLTDVNDVMGNCATTGANNDLWCWGYNGTYKVGQNDTTDRTKAVKVHGVNGSGFLSNVVDFDMAFRDNSGNMAILEDGSAVAWGQGTYGNLGNGAATHQMVAGYVRNESSSGSALVNGSITTGHIANGSITTAKLADGAVTLDKIDFSSTSQALPVPYMSETSRDAISGAQNGQMVINSDTFEINYMADGMWKTASGTGGGGANSVTTSSIVDGAVTLSKLDLTDVSSALTLTNVTEAQRDAIASPSEGMIIYNTDSNMLQVYSGGKWTNLINKEEGEGPDATFQSVVGGLHHACSVMSDKTVRCWGVGGSGHLGNLTDASSYTPTTVYKLTGEPLDNITQIDLEGETTCALDTAGDVWCWGLNHQGQLGNGTTTTSLGAIKVDGISNAVMVKSSYDFTCALINDGTMKCWGLNSSYALGNGTTTSSYVPVDVTVINDVRQMDVGYNTACAVKNNNALYCWGLNNYGQIGNGSTATASGAVLVATNVSKVVVGMSLYVNSGNYWRTSTCAIKTNGDLYCWGFNNVGHAGDGTTNQLNTPVLSYKDDDYDGTHDGKLTNVKDVIINGRTAYAVREDGSVWAAGENDWYGLGNGTTADEYYFVPVLGVGGVGTLTNAKSVGGGTYYASPGYAVLEDGKLVSWGWNGRAQVGDGTTTTRAVPQYIYDREGTGTRALVNDTIASDHLMDDSVINSKIADGAVTISKVDLSSSDSALTIPYVSTTNRDAITPVVDGQVMINSDTYEFNYVANGVWKTVGATGVSAVDTPNINDGAVTSTKIDLSDTSSPLTFTNVTSAQRDAIASPSEGMIVYNSDNNELEVYTGSGWQPLSDKTDAAPQALFSKVSAEYVSTCSVMTDKTVRCWGDNGYGQLGSNSTVDELGPSKVYNSDGVPLTNIVDISGQEDGYCALDAAGEVWCWGYNVSGALGQGDTVSLYTAKKVPGLDNVIKVDGGYRYNCALKNDGNLWCWGLGDYYQLGVGTTATSLSPTLVTQIDDIKDFSTERGTTCVVKNDNSLYCWGLNNYGQVGNGTTTTATSPILIMTSVKSVSSGYHHNRGSYLYSNTCAVKTDDTLWCWGNNSWGQLSIGNTTQQTSPVQVEFDAAKDGTSDGYISGVDRVYVNGTNICAIKNDKTLWCAGANGANQATMADGTTTQRNYMAQVGGVGGTGLLTGVVEFARTSYVNSTNIAILEDGSLVAWGYNAYGTVGDNSLTNAPYPKYVTDQDGSTNTMGADSIATAHLQDGSVTNSKLGAEAVADTNMSGITTGCANGEVLRTNGLGSFYCSAAADSHSLDSSDGSVTDALYVDASGNVGIGITSSLSYKLHVNGTAGGTSPYDSSSDIRFKKNLTPIADSESALEKIMQLEGLYFDWRNDEFPKYQFKESRDMGVIAQNVRDIFPEAVNENDEGYLSVAYAKLVAPLIEAVKELFGMVSENQRSIASINDEVEDLKEENEKLNQKLESKEQELQTIKAYLCAKDQSAAFCK